MILDIYRGAFQAARSLGAQYADAQDAAQETVLRALGRAVYSPRAFGRSTVRFALADQRRKGKLDCVELPAQFSDKAEGIDIDALREALKRCGADRFHKAKRGERANIRARLVKEGWGLS